MGLSRLSSASTPRPAADFECRLRAMGHLRDRTATFSGSRTNYSWGCISHLLLTLVVVNACAQKAIYILTDNTYSCIKSLYTTAVRQRTRPRTRPVFPLYTLDRTHEDPTMPPYTTGSVRDRGQEGRTLQSTAVQSTVEEVSCLNAQWVTR